MKIAHTPPHEDMHATRLPSYTPPWLLLMFGVTETVPAILSDSLAPALMKKQGFDTCQHATTKMAYIHSGLDMCSSRGYRDRDVR